MAFHVAEVPKCQEDKTVKGHTLNRHIIQARSRELFWPYRLDRGWEISLSPPPWANFDRQAGQLASQWPGLIMKSSDTEVGCPAHLSNSLVQHFLIQCNELCPSYAWCLERAGCRVYKVLGTVLPKYSTTVWLPGACEVLCNGALQACWLPSFGNAPPLPALHLTSYIHQV